MSLQNIKLDLKLLKNPERIKDQLEAIKKIKSKEDKIMKHPEVIKFSVENFHQKQRFSSNGNSARIDSVLNAQQNDSSFLKSFKDTYRKVQEERLSKHIQQNISQSYNSQSISPERSRKISPLQSKRRFDKKSSVLILVAEENGQQKLGQTIGLQGLNQDYGMNSSIQQQKNIKINPMSQKILQNKHNVESSDEEMSLQQRLGSSQSYINQISAKNKSSYQIQRSQVKQRQVINTEETFEKNIGILGNNLYKDQNYIKELGDEPGLVQVEDTNPTKDSLKIQYQQTGNKNGNLKSTLNEQSDYTTSVDNLVGDYDHLKFPALKNAISHQEISQSVKKNASNKLILNDNWYIIDPVSSINAMQIYSWTQEQDIKLLIKLKLNYQNLKMDPTIETDLNNFIQMKQNTEMQKQLHSNLKKSHVQMVGKNQKGTFLICRELSKWLKDNQKNFIQEFQPSHIKYNVNSLKYNTRNLESNMNQSKSLKELDKISKSPEQFPESNKYLNLSKMSQISGPNAEIRGIQALESIRNEFPKDRYKNIKGFHQIIQQIKQIQKQEIKWKATQQIEKSVEEVYGLKVNTLSSKIENDKEFEKKLKQHLIIKNAQKLTSNLKIYQKQQNEQQVQKDEYSPWKMQLNGDIQKEKNLLRQNDYNFDTDKRRVNSELKSIRKKRDISKQNILDPIIKNAEKISSDDVKESIKKFFDILENQADKTSKEVFKAKLMEITLDKDGIYYKKNLQSIQELDKKTRDIKKEKKKNEQTLKELKMKTIFENTPYAFEACRFDMIMNPQKWYAP